MTSMNVVPIVLPHELEGFEAFAGAFAKNQREEGSAPATFGMNTFGDSVVYAVNFTSSVIEGVKYRDTGVVFKGRFDILTPAFNTFVPFIFLLNTYSFRNNYISIDQLIENHYNGIRDVSVTSDFIQLLTNPTRMIPSTLFYYPVFPNDNKTNLVGFIQLGHDWEKTVEFTIPSVDADLWVQIHRVHNQDTSLTMSDKGTYLFEIIDGRVVDIIFQGTVPKGGVAQDYERDYPPIFGDVDCAGCDLFSFTFYPTERGYKKYFTNTPIYGAIVTFAVTFMLGFCFLMYDLSLSRETHRQMALLESKRLFVRFISHEIRTPLNTTGIGLKILMTEISNMVDEVGITKALRQNLSSWLELVEEVNESSSTAVIVLDDLINYDKIESNTLIIDKKLIHAETFLYKSLKALHPHGPKTGINYIIEYGLSHPSVDTRNIVNVRNTCNAECDTNNIGSENYSVVPLQDTGVLMTSFTDSGPLEVDGGAGESFRHPHCKLDRNLCLLGDSFKISQVIRNIVSNAVKFSSNGKNVTVRGTT